MMFEYNVYCPTNSELIRINGYIEATNETDARLKLKLSGMDIISIRKLQTHEIKIIKLKAYKEKLCGHKKPIIEKQIEKPTLIQKILHLFRCKN